MNSCFTVILTYRKQNWIILRILGTSQIFGEQRSAGMSVRAPALPRAAQREGAFPPSAGWWGGGGSGARAAPPPASISEFYRVAFIMNEIGGLVLALTPAGIRQVVKNGGPVFRRRERRAAPYWLSYAGEHFSG